MTHKMHRGDGLLLVDVQKDFCPGGKLAIDGGDAIVPALNDWIAEAVLNKLPVYASRDWHPVRHVSFQDEGGLWPPHCIADTEGAQFHPDLQVPEAFVLITKGVRFDQDQNSVFDQTGFEFQLHRDSVNQLWIGGLALDVCVLASVLDALRLGFAVKLIKNATKAVQDQDGLKALRQMQEAGAELI